MMPVMAETYLKRISYLNWAWESRKRSEEKVKIDDGTRRLRYVMYL